MATAGLPTSRGTCSPPGWGRLTAINRPGVAGTAAFDINNRGQIVGFAPIADAAPSPQPTDPPPNGSDGLTTGRP